MSSVTSIVGTWTGYVAWGCAGPPVTSSSTVWTFHADGRVRRRPLDSSRGPGRLELQGGHSRTTHGWGGFGLHSQCDPQLTRWHHGLPVAGPSPGRDASTPCAKRKP